MTFNFLQRIAGCALLITVLVPGESPATPQRTRMQREASEVFATLLTNMPSPKRCEYDVTWSSEGIPDYVARAEFHLVVRAGLLPPSVTPDLRAILDPEHRKTTSFCTDEALKAFTVEQVNAFEHSTEQSMQIDRTLFSFPIFDDRFLIAVVVVQRFALDGRFRLNGKIGRHPTGLGSSAEIYRKVDGRWRFTRSIELEIS